jgi:hypothetical protein
MSVPEAIVYEVVERREYRVESLNGISAVFHGPGAKKRAEEYAAWKTFEDSRVAAGYDTPVAPI